MNHLLLCVDGSAYAEPCCRYASWLASRTNASLSSLYVTEYRHFELPALADLGGSLGLQPYENLTAQIAELEQEKARLLSNATQHILEASGYGGDYAFHHATGSIVDAVAALENTPPSPDLIILGKRGEHANFATGHLGSSMERIVRASRRPCLVANREARDIRRLALAYDGAPAAHKALEWLLLHSDLRGLEFHILTVDEHNLPEDALQHLKRAQNLLTTADYAPQCQMLTGEASMAIAAYVHAQDIDLLITGAYGHNRIRELLLGSTTTELLRDCTIPLLLFR